MKVRLGRKGDYAVRAVLHLARHYGRGLRKAREVTADVEVPATYLPQILGDLIAAGIVTSVAGRDGGYALARAPGDVSLLEVLEAVEGDTQLTECVLQGGPCRWETECAVHRFWSQAQEGFRSRLADTSFADVAARDGQLH